MLYFITVWIFLSITCSIVGTAVLQGLQANCFVRAGDRIIVAIWLGLVILAIALLTVSFGLPLSPWVGAMVAASLCGLSLRSKRTRAEIARLRLQFAIFERLGLLALAATIAASVCRQVTWFDTATYHYGAIQWLSKYGAVPGLALLNPQFGFVSAWFALAAPLNAPVFQGRVCAAINGFVLFIAVLHFCISLFHLAARKAQQSDWLVLIFSLLTIPALLLLPDLSWILISPSPDIPIIFLIEAIAWSILIIAKPSTENPSTIQTADLMPLILSTGAVSIKLTALPLLFISVLFYCGGRGVTWQRLLAGTGVAIGLLLPILALGLLTTGCPAYPSSFFCLDLPWSQTLQDTTTMAGITRVWGTWLGSAPAGIHPLLWVVWQWVSIKRSGKVILVATLFSGFAIFYVLRAAKANPNKGLLWVMTLALVGSGFILTQAPIMRMGMGYVVLLPVLAIATFCQTKFQVMARANTLRGDDLGFTNLNHLKKWPILFGLAGSIAMGLSNQSIQTVLLWPPLPHRPDLLQRQVNDVTYFSPAKPPWACWAAPLPCAVKPAIDIKLRDPSRGLGAGFVRFVPR
ncbi:LIC_10190 family membrane protein [Altericista sp. CCNU0014]|uniref:LIC_10190 family membrane protein n=1 Tax=Altericista sp. CCNU0014 TaxID=3082949 RepID=UPI00384AE735